MSATEFLCTTWTEQRSQRTSAINVDSCGITVMKKH